MRLFVAAALVASSLSALVRPAAALQQFVDVREIATDTLHDVALTALARGRPTIYYNPFLMQQIGPDVAAFMMAHEFGHVRYGHTSGFLRSPVAGVTAAASGPIDASRRQQQELEADCYAGRILDDTNPAAVRAAIRFFTAMGPFRFDSLHPAGTQRAETIRSCLPDHGTDQPAGPAPDAP